MGSAALALGAAANAHAAFTIGDTNGATDNCGSNQNLVQVTTAAGPSYVASSGGVVVSWSYLAHSLTPTIKLKVYAPTAGDDTKWFLRSASVQKSGGTGPDKVEANKLNTFTESPGLRIASGDHLGLTGLSGSGMACIETMNSGDLVRVKNPPDSTAGENTFPGPLTGQRIGVTAVVEPDADGDFFGDESQDSCPTDATVHTGSCPVDVSIVKTASGTPSLDGNLTYTLAVRNNHATNPAEGVSVIDPLPAGATFVSSASDRGSCTGTTNVSCSVGTLAAGQSANIAIVVRPTATGPLTNTASVTTTASDTDTGNNSSSAQVTVPPRPLPVLSAFKLKPSSFRAPAGTTVSYKVTQASTTTFTLYRRAAGVRKGKRCVAPPKKAPNKKPKRCTRLLKLRTFTRLDAAGPVSFHFSAKVKEKKLKPGRYRLQAVARNGTGPSKPVKADFTIKK
jgi:uncharacterized repeat protein (TIGR01451 family)